MARPPRDDVPGAIHHVTFRGNARQRLFDDDRDRHMFLQELQEVVPTLDWVVLSYCLMDNHVHLLVECPRAGLSVGMQRIESRYARRRHVRHGTSGHVYEGRFKSKVVTTDEQLLMTVAYIARNPVDAGLCRDPGDWPWSSHRAVLHHDPTLVDVKRLFELLGARGGRGADRYLALLACATDDVPRPVVVPRRRRLATILAHPSTEAMAEAHFRHGYGVREIAAEARCSPATVSRRLRSVKPGWVKRV